MSGPRTSKSSLRPWHARVEHYTPGGPVGRLLLATAAVSVGGSALFFAVVSVVSAVAFWPVLATLASGIGLGAVGLALVVLWPVYLSLIGNVESASEYPETASVASLSDEDAVSVLKRRYAAGDISESEFERQVDDLLGVEGVLDSHRESTGRERGNAVRDTERN
ncbi:SHOCT domain-containing protein [Halorussus amylolyticus]|uniref:SHOCT domain-containing protein n=1 Tax=Halorussus amylolyticus TaxID=1126242 RepID=UPI0010432637|nr:SHOCT domain-containing protein [Halorussus amylolyticus]